MSFFTGIRNIENVRTDITTYFEKEFIEKKFVEQNLDLDKLYTVIDYMLVLAKEMHLDFNISFAIAVLHDYKEDEADENNFGTLVSVVSEKYLYNFFSVPEMEIIVSACKEHDRNNDEHHQYTSLYSKAIADADTMAIMRIEQMLEHFWLEYSNEYPKATDKEVFDKMYEFLMDNYSHKTVDSHIILKKSYDIVKNDLERTINILKSREETLQLFLLLVKYGEITIKRDGTLTLENQPQKIAIVDNTNTVNSFTSFEESVGKDETELASEYNEILNEAPVTKKPTTPREKTEALIYKVLNALDDTGINVQKYKAFFSKMTNEQFDKYMKTFLKDENENFYLEILPNKNEPSLAQVKKALDILKVPTDEYVYMRHEGHKDNPIRTQYKVPTGYITIKRVQQILSKKNTYSLDIAQRNMKNGQVTGSDRIARISDVESYSLVAIGADSALQEFLGPRADNAVAKTDMYKDINSYGYTYLKNLSRDISENQTLNTMYVYLMGAGLANDLLKEDMSAEELLSRKVGKLANG